jgi:hypothetical protein
MTGQSEIEIGKVDENQELRSPLAHHFLQTTEEADKEARTSKNLPYTYDRKFADVSQELHARALELVPAHAEDLGSRFHREQAFYNLGSVKIA